MNKYFTHPGINPNRYSRESSNLHNNIINDGLAKKLMNEIAAFAGITDFFLAE